MAVSYLVWGTRPWVLLIAGGIVILVDDVDVKNAEFGSLHARYQTRFLQ